MGEKVHFDMKNWWE